VVQVTVDRDKVLSTKRRYGWVILLGDEEKSPEICGKWQDLKTQSEEDLDNLLKRVGRKALNWGPICGINDLVALDCDWAFVYGLLTARFGDRFNTLTFQTPNGGARPFFQTVEKVQGDPFKNTLHLELKGSRRYVAVGGEAVTEDGSMKPYTLFLDKPISRDDTIIRDVSDFLHMLLKGQYSWLKYKCIQAHMNHKHVMLDHDQGLAINAFMMTAGCDDLEIHNFRRGLYAVRDGRHVPEYDAGKTEAQIRSGRQYTNEGGKPWPCEPNEKNRGLASTFNWDPAGCGGCPRKEERGIVRTMEGIAMGGYVLRAEGSAAMVYNAGEPVWSTKLSSLTGLHTKRDLAKELGLERSIVDKAVARLLHDQAAAKPTPSVAVVSSPPELEARAEELLRDPKMLCYVDEALREQGLVGETKNAFSTFYDILSTLTGNPINRRWSGRSGVGKTAIVMKTSRLFPPEWLIIRAGLSKKAVWNMPGSEEVEEGSRILDLRGKVLIILEESESQEVLDEMKPLLSHDREELTYEFTVKEAEGMTTYRQTLRGWPTYIGITTAPEMREEQQTRALIGSADRGKKKYGAVIGADAELAAAPWEKRQVVWTPVIQEAVRRLKPLKVWMRWLPIVAEAFPKDEAKSMREWFFFRSFLESIALSLQYQLPHIVFNGEEYVCAPVFILELGLLIGEAAFQETVTGLERDLRTFVEHLAGQTGGPWTYKDLLKQYQACFGESISESTLRRRYTDRLLDLGLLDLDDSKKPYKLRLGEKPSTISTNLKKSLEKIHSEKARLVLTLKTSTTRMGGIGVVVAFLPDGGSLSWEELVEKHLYSPSLVEDVKSLFKRSKDEEYPEKKPFSDLVEVVDDSGEKKPNQGEMKEAPPPSEAEQVTPAAQPALREAIHGFLDAEGGNTTISRLESHLEQQGFGLDGLNKELHRLQYRGCILMTGNTISLGLEWRKPSGDEKPSSEGRTGGTPEEVKPGVEDVGEEPVDAETKRLEDLNDIFLIEGIVNREQSIGAWAIKERLEYRRARAYHIDYVTDILRQLASEGAIQFDGVSANSLKPSRSRGGESP
jgi:hypothetical protein